MLSPLCVLRMLSAIVGLTSIVTSFEHAASCDFCGTVLVTCGWRRVRFEANEAVPSSTHAELGGRAGELGAEEARTTRCSIGSPSIIFMLVSDSKPTDMVHN